MTVHVALLQTLSLFWYALTFSSNLVTKRSVLNNSILHVVPWRMSLMSHLFFYPGPVFRKEIPLGTVPGLFSLINFKGLQWGIPSLVCYKLSGHISQPNTCSGWAKIKKTIKSRYYIKVIVWIFFYFFFYNVILFIGFGVTPWRSLAKPMRKDWLQDYHSAVGETLTFLQTKQNVLRWHKTRNRIKRGTEWLHPCKRKGNSC